MSNWLIVLVCVVVLSYGMIHGLLMLISPEKHRRFNLRVNNPFGRLKLPPPDRDINQGLELEYRLAGLAIVVMCGFIAWGSVYSLLGHHHEQILPGQDPGDRHRQNLVGLRCSRWMLCLRCMCFPPTL